MQSLNIFTTEADCKLSAKHLVNFARNWPIESEDETEQVLRSKMKFLVGRFTSVGQPSARKGTEDLTEQQVSAPCGSEKEIFSN